MSSYNKIKIFDQLLAKSVNKSIDFEDHVHNNYKICLNSIDIRHRSLTIVNIFYVTETVESKQLVPKSYVMGRWDVVVMTGLWSHKPLFKAH